MAGEARVGAREKKPRLRAGSLCYHRCSITIRRLAVELRLYNTQR